VQSTAIVMLAINRDKRLLDAMDGVLPELYVFADTGDEPVALYPHLEKMERRIVASGAAYMTVNAKQVPISTYVEEKLNEGTRMEQLPLWVETDDGDMAPLIRGCTPFFKIAPIRRSVNEYFGVYLGKVPEGVDGTQAWLGISKDEERRMKVGRVDKQRWLEYKMPLIDMNWHRADCINYLNDIGIPAMRSACVFCPYHSMAEWRRVASVPEDWAAAIKLDEAIEAEFKEHGCIGRNREKKLQIRNEPFLNRYGVRLRDLDLTEPDNPQQTLFDNECAGICGV